MWGRGGGGRIGGRGGGEDGGILDMRDLGTVTGETQCPNRLENNIVNPEIKTNVHYSLLKEECNEIFTSQFCFAEPKAGPLIDMLKYFQYGFDFREDIRIESSSFYSAVSLACGVTNVGYDNLFLKTLFS